MAIKKFDLDNTQAYGDYKQLPKGGYKCKVIAAKVDENSRGQYVKIAVDIAEGEYKDYFKEQFDSNTREDKKWPCNYFLSVPNNDGTEQDGWTARRFKTVINAFEDSNEGFHFDWDEKKFKGKFIGGLFNIREYEKSDGSVGRAINIAQLCAIKKIEDGSFTIPEDKLINPSSSIPGKAEGFMEIPEGAEEEIPF